MPLRDHFRPPLTNIASWEELHGMWPCSIAYRLNAVLPPEYRCGVNNHLGNAVEIDVGAFQRESGALDWEAAAPSLLLDTDELTPPEYEVRVYDLSRTRRLVAAVEIVSPGNEDRTEARDAFVSKCHACLQEGVCVVIVDPVTIRSANLYAELAERIGARMPAAAETTMYAVACRAGRFSRAIPRGSLGTCPGARHPVAHVAALDQRGAIRASRTRTDVRGSLSRPSDRVTAE